MEGSTINNLEYHSTKITAEGMAINAAHYNCSAKQETGMPWHEHVEHA